MDKSILQSEYDKAARRMTEQREVVRQTEIAANQRDFPSLAATAKRRLPKLRDTLAETEALVLELSKALGLDQVQLDIETVLQKPEAPATGLPVGSASSKKP